MMRDVWTALRVAAALAALLTQTGCFGALDFRSQSRGRLLAEEVAPQPDVPNVWYATELEVFPNPEWYYASKKRSLTDDEWEAAADAWRDRYAKVLLNVVSANLPGIEVVFVEPGQVPEEGKLLASRMVWADNNPKPPWAYFTVTVTDLGSDREEYFARVEVPASVTVKQSLEYNIGWAVMNFSHLIESILRTGRLSPIRATQTRPWTLGRYEATQRERRYWFRRSQKAEEAGEHEKSARLMRRAAQIDKEHLEARTILKGTPSCQVHFAAGGMYNECIQEELERYR